MTITITESKNDAIPPTKVVKENMNVLIKGIPEGVSRRNGMIYCLAGSGGSGKSNCLFNLLTTKELYKNKFDKIYYFVPETSFLSVAKHPLRNHPRVYHDLTIEALESIIDEIEENKRQAEAEDEEMEFSLIILDDFASVLKDKAMTRFLNRTLTRARHLQCGFIFTLQSYMYMPLMLRKQITFVTIFKPKNKLEMEKIASELISLTKDDALILSQYIYSEPYSHLDVDLVESKYYRNFNPLVLTED